MWEIRTIGRRKMENQGWAWRGGQETVERGLRIRSSSKSEKR